MKTTTTALLLALVLPVCAFAQEAETPYAAMKFNEAAGTAAPQSTSENATQDAAPPTLAGHVMKELVDSYADKHNVPRRIAHGVILVESRYNCQAYNRRSRASGIGQVLPSTARAMGVHGSLMNCHNGLEASMRYLKLAINRGGAGCAGVSLYNRGVEANPVCTGYGRKVMARQNS